MDVYICLSCAGIVTHRMHAVCCDVCDRWQHRVCKSGASTGVSSTDYRAMVQGDLHVDWTCEPCRTDVHNSTCATNTLALPSRRLSTSSIRSLNTTMTDLVEHLHADKIEDITDRNFEIPIVPLDESLQDRQVDDDIPEEQPESFHIIENGSNKGRKKLVSDRGYSYVITKASVDRTYWTCSVRSKRMKCQATVKQFGDMYSNGLHSHSHPAEPGALRNVKIKTLVKQTARRNLTRSAAKIVETILKESTTHNDVPLPKPEYLARIANHHRQQMRPRDPTSQLLRTCSFIADLGPIPMTDRVHDEELLI